MTTQPIPLESQAGVRMGGYAAMAESAWMGSVQATEVLDSLRAGEAELPRRAILPRLPKIRVGSLKGRGFRGFRGLRGLYLRELSIPEASFVLMAAFFLSALLGAVRQVLFNAQFGTGVEASAYYAAFRLPDTLFSLIAGGALSSAMIPVLLAAEQNEGRRAALRLINLVLTALLLVFALVVLAGELFAPFFITRLLAPGFDPQTSALTVRLTRIMLLQPLVLVIGSAATAVLNSRNQFIPTSLSILGHNVALIGGILAAQAVPGLGILGPTLGVVAGAVLQVALLLPGLLGRGVRFGPAFNPGDARLREVVRLLVPNGLSVSVNYAGFIVDTAFASRVANLAALPALYNAWLMVGLPIALIGQAIGQAAFPRLADHAAAGAWREMRATFTRSLAAAAALALPAVLALLFLGRLGIRVFLERGQFSPAAGDLTFQVLQIYAIGLPAYVTTELVTRALIALRDTRTPLLTNLLQLAGRILIMTLFIDSWGTLAIPAAFAISAAAETLILTAVLVVRLQQRISSRSYAPA